jgi:predicted hydrocarbon binding protein
VPLGDEGVSISYTSERKLCELLEGLVLGVAEYYREVVSVEQPLCMHRGDVACSVLVTPAHADALLTAREP